MRKTGSVELRILKGILWVYIILCLVIAGLNYGYASKASPEVAEFINSFWHFYENWIKTVFILAGSILTLRIIGTDRKVLRKKNLIGFGVAALAVHIIGPLILHNKELYFFAMPLPWTTTPLQLLEPESSFYLSRFPVWGIAGISASLLFYICVSAVIFVGTILFGRRWQCSTLCLFNGFAAEVFEPAFPLLGKRKRLTHKKIEIFTWLRWLFLAGALFFTVWWILYLSGIRVPGHFETISSIEVYKYLAAELMVMMFFWVVFSGRGYCYYCPLGTVLAFLSRLSGQHIVTDRTKCVQCNQCNLACPMGIDIKTQAQSKKPVRDLRCVGCGHCIDACTTRTLAYTTGFLSWMEKRKNRRNTGNTSGNVNERHVFS